jgi:O-antigen ligase
MTSLIFYRIKRYFSANDERYVFAVFLMINAVLLTKIVGGSAWITIFTFVLIGIFIWLKISDLATAFLLVTIFSLQFYAPNKYYIVEVFRQSALIPGWGNYLLSYGVNLANIYLMITAGIIIRNFLLKKWSFPKTAFKSIIPVIASAVIFFLVSLYSSAHYSPYANLSVTWLIQYTQMFILAICIFAVFLNKPEKLKLIMPTILSGIFLQSVVSILQFVKQSSIGIPVESFKINSIYYGAPDAVHNLFRVAGTFGQPNQMSLILVAMIAIILPTAVRRRDPLYVLGVIIAVAVIILTQSRSGWIALISVLICTHIFYKNEIRKLVFFLGARRVYFFISIALLTTSVALVTRITASLNAFYEGAGAPLRVEMVKEAAQAISQRPLAGYGAGTNEPVLLNFFPRGYIYSFPAPVHIAYVQLILESGVVGFLAFLFPMFFITRCIINQYLLAAKGLLKKIKDFIFITVAGFLTFGLFYLFQPHQGYLEFPYLGIILGYGIICIQDIKIFKNEIKKAV